MNKLEVYLQKGYNIIKNNKLMVCYLPHINQFYTTDINSNIAIAYSFKDVNEAFEVCNIFNKQIERKEI